MPAATSFALDPRLAADTHAVGDLSFARVLLMDDARFPWLILVPRRANLRELIELSQAGQHHLLDEVDRCAHVLQAQLRPDKLNIATLGNVVAQLHVHVIARFTTDAAWPRPVWGVGTAERYAAAALTSRLAELRQGLQLAHA